MPQNPQRLRQVLPPIPHSDIPPTIVKCLGASTIKCGEFLYFARVSRQTTRTVFFSKKAVLLWMSYTTVAFSDPQTGAVARLIPISDIALLKRNLEAKMLSIHVEGEKEALLYFPMEEGNNSDATTQEIAQLMGNNGGGGLEGFCEKLTLLRKIVPSPQAGDVVPLRVEDVTDSTTMQTDSIANMKAFSSPKQSSANGSSSSPASSPQSSVVERKLLSMAERAKAAAAARRAKEEEARREAERQKILEDETKDKKPITTKRGDLVDSDFDELEGPQHNPPSAGRSNAGKKDGDDDVHSDLTSTPGVSQRTLEPSGSNVIYDDILDDDDDDFMLGPSAVSPSKRRGSVAPCTSTLSITGVTSSSVDAAKSSDGFQPLLLGGAGGVDDDDDDLLPPSKPSSTLEENPFAQQWKINTATSAGTTATTAAPSNGSHGANKKKMNVFSAILDDLDENDGAANGFQNPGTHDGTAEEGSGILPAATKRHHSAVEPHASSTNNAQLKLEQSPTVGDDPLPAAEESVDSLFLGPISPLTDESGSDDDDLILPPPQKEEKNSTSQLEIDVL